eukprot:jgi/Mesen1/5988/ME000303S05099
MVTRPSFSFFVVCVNLMAVHSISGVRIQEADHSALLNLRKGFQDQSALQSWDGVECDDFYGVSCTAAGHVYYLYLTFESLGGALAPAICSLTSLTFLRLENCKLSGSIPGCVGNLASLQSLSLAHNNFSSPLPTGLCHLKNLQTLRELGLPYWRAFVSSELDNLWILASEHTAIMDLLDCVLVAYKWPAAAHHQTQDLYENHFSGPIPGCFQDLAALPALHVSGNRLSGPLPAELCLIKSLRYL